MTLKDLPNEILNEVFTLVSRATVYQCLFVCKAWSMAAIQAYCKEVSITENNIAHVQRQLSQQNAMFQRVITYGEVVRKLKILDTTITHRRANHQFNQDQLAAFFSSLPQLRCIDLVSARNKCYIYMGYLETIFKKEEAGKGEFLKYLEDFQATFMTKNGMIRYFRICYLIRDRLKHLVVQNIGDQMMPDDFQVGYPLGFLAHFPRLTRLDVRNEVAFYVSKKLTTETMVSIFTQCPNLTHFNLNSTFPIQTTITVGSEEEVKVKEEEVQEEEEEEVQEEEEEEEEEEEVQEDVYSLTEGIIALEYPVSVVLPKDIVRRLESLTVRLPYIGIDHLMGYLKAAPRLHTLNLTMDQQLFDLWLHACGDNDRQAFTDKLHSLPNFNLAWTGEPKQRIKDVNYDDRKQACSQALEGISLQSRLDNFLSFVTSISKDRNILCNLHLDIFDTAVPTSQQNQVAIVQGGKMNVRYSVQLKEKNNLAISTFLSSILVGLSNDTVIYSVSMNLDISSQYQNGAYCGAPINFVLQHVMSNCPYLTHIALDYRHGMTVYNFKSELYKSINDTNMITAEKYQQFLLAASTPSSLENFTQLTMQGSQIMPQFNSMISESFNNLESITFLQPPVRDTLTTRTQLDFKYLTHLQQFKFDMARSVTYSNIYFELTICEMQDIEAGVLQPTVNRRTIICKCVKDKEMNRFSVTRLSREHLNSDVIHFWWIQIHFSRIDRFIIYSSQTGQEMDLDLSA